MSDMKRFCFLLENLLLLLLLATTTTVQGRVLGRQRKVDSEDRVLYQESRLGGDLDSEDDDEERRLKYKKDKHNSSGSKQQRKYRPSSKKGAKSRQGQNFDEASSEEKDDNELGMLSSFSFSFSLETRFECPNLMVGVPMMMTTPTKKKKKAAKKAAKKARKAAKKKARKSTRRARKKANKARKKAKSKTFSRKGAKSKEGKKAKGKQSNYYSSSSKTKKKGKGSSASSDSDSYGSVTSTTSSPSAVPSFQPTSTMSSTALAEPRGTTVPFKVVIVGDSYAAGTGARDLNGARNYDGGTACYRSPWGWGHQYARQLSQSRRDLSVTVINRACVDTRAEIQDIRSPLDQAVDKDTDLVLLSAGMNDLDLRGALVQCFVRQSAPRCSRTLAQVRDKLGIFQNRTEQLLISTQRRARQDTKVVVVGYPLLARANDDTAEVLLGNFTTVETRKRGNLTVLDHPPYFAASMEVRDVGRLMNQAQRQGVANANVRAGQDFATFVSIQELFAGHEVHPRVCFNTTTSAQGEPWVHGFEDAWQFGEEYRYNQRGHDAIAKKLSTFGDFGASRPPLGNGTNTLDIAFVVDTSGSMQDNIDAVRDELRRIFDLVEDSTRRFRVTIVEYRFWDRDPATLVLPFSNDRGPVRDAISQLEAGDGGDESPWSGLMLAFDQPWSQGSTRIAIVFGDEPATNPEPRSGFNLNKVVERAAQVNVVIFGVNIDNGLGGDVRKAAERTGGEFLTGGTDDVANRIKRILRRVARVPLAWVGEGYYGYRGSPVRFDGSGSYAIDNTVLVSFEWDVDDDGIFDAVTTEPFYQHLYPNVFRGFVTLRVTDSANRTSDATAPVDVSGDADAVPNNLDNCPNENNPSQTDSNDNGIGDACDIFDSRSQRVAPIVTILCPTPVLNVEPLERVRVVGAAGDMNGDRLSVSWIIAGDEEEEMCEIAHPSELDTTVSCKMIGEFDVVLVVEDNRGLISSDSIRLVVGTNRRQLEGRQLEGSVATTTTLDQEKCP